MPLSLKLTNGGFLAGGLFGLTAVALGAYTDHVARPVLSPQDYDSVMTALHYQLMHAVVLTAISLPLPASVSKGLLHRLHWAKGLITAGLLLFCGGIYIHVLGHCVWAIHLAPTGGFCLMLGWIALTTAGFVKQRDSQNGLTVQLVAAKITGLFLRR